MRKRELLYKSVLKWNYGPSGKNKINGSVLTSLISTMPRGRKGGSIKVVGWVKGRGKDCDREGVD